MSSAGVLDKTHFASIPLQQEMTHLLREHIEQISPLTDEEWDFVRPFFVQKKFRKHQFLVQEGNAVLQEFWIIKGLVKSYVIDKEGKEHILHFALEGHWTSDYYAFQFQQPAQLFVECIEAADFFCLALDDRETICNRVPAMANFFRKKSNRGYIALQQRVLSLLTETVETRYANFIRNNPVLIERVPKKMLAAYLGVTRETLSRLKSNNK